MRKRLLPLGLAGVLFVAVGCSLTGGSDRRSASLWRGVLVIDQFAGKLRTPEVDVIPLLPDALTMRVGPDNVGVRVAGDRVVATGDDDVTLFGGAGSDGALVVCDVEENRSG